MFTDYTLSDWIADARLVLNMLRDGPPITIVGNSLGGWIAWLMAQEYPVVEKLILIAPAFNMMGARAKSIDPERRHAWHSIGWMPWDDEPAHRDFPLAWKWVEESEADWKTSFDRLRPVKTTILHGLLDTVILPNGSSEFVEQLLSRDPAFPVELDLIPGDHRLSSHEQVERFRRLVLETP
jgi:pimeloyl-ACP methyl ester carboxylesterase